MRRGRGRGGPPGPLPRAPFRRLRGERDFMLPQEGGGEGGEETGYREERGKKWTQKEKRLIKRPGAGRTGGPTVRVPITVSRSSHQAPTPSTSHMFWNLSPQRGGVGGDRGQTSVWPRREAIFSAAGPICAV